jgi:hypothetical protein
VRAQVHERLAGENLHRRANKAQPEEQSKGVRPITCFFGAEHQGQQAAAAAADTEPAADDGA